MYIFCILHQTKLKNKEVPEQNFKVKTFFVFCSVVHKQFQCLFSRGCKCYSSVRKIVISYTLSFRLEREVRPLFQGIELRHRKYLFTISRSIPHTHSLSLSLSLSLCSSQSQKCVRVHLFFSFVFSPLFDLRRN